MPTSAQHPLRQTSFPPAANDENTPLSLEAQHALAEDADLRRYSPGADDQDDEDDGADLDEFSDDNDIRSAISGPVEGGDSFSRKRKRGEKRPRGRPAKSGVGTFLRAGSWGGMSGEEGTGGGGRGKRGGSRSVISGADGGEDDNGDEDDDEEEETTGDAEARGGRIPLYEGGQLTSAEVAEEKDRRYFFDAGTRGVDHTQRYEAYNRAKLKTSDVRRLVNQVLGQSVPANVVLAVSAYTKLFAGELIEAARDVQAEWEAVALERADGQKNDLWEKIRRSREGGKVEGDAGAYPASAGANGDAGKSEQGGQDGVKCEPTSPEVIRDSLPVVTNGHVATEKKERTSHLLARGGTGGLGREIEECDRGPLLPDHLREALRRYKKRRGGGAVGFTGLSLEGVQNTAPKMGGRRLFR